MNQTVAAAQRHIADIEARVIRQSAMVERSAKPVSIAHKRSVLSAFSSKRSPLRTNTFVFCCPAGLPRAMPFDINSSASARSNPRRQTQRRNPASESSGVAISAIIRAGWKAIRRGKREAIGLCLAEAACYWRRLGCRSSLDMPVMSSCLTASDKLAKRIANR